MSATKVEESAKDAKGAKGSEDTKAAKDEQDQAEGQAPTGEKESAKGATSKLVLNTNSVSSETPEELGTRSVSIMPYDWSLSVMVPADVTR